MQLSISTKPGLIGIRTTPGQWNMESRTARLEMHQKHAALTIETRRPVLEINQYQVRAQLGYKSTADTTLELSQLGRQKAMEYIASKTEEGNRLKAIEKGGNPIREISIDKRGLKSKSRVDSPPSSARSFTQHPGSHHHATAGGKPNPYWV